MSKGKFSKAKSGRDVTTLTVETARHRVLMMSQRLPPSLTPILLIVLVVLFANVTYVTGLTNSDPISWTSGITHSLCGLWCGRSSSDINIGVITQPLGHLSAMDVLHGHLPWWNYFEGLGQPLAGEMQSAALFPLTLLLALSGGLVWFHIALEVLAGLSTYFLVRRLDIPNNFAVVGGMLFSLNGTYAWLGNSVVNPVAFLPLTLLGIEMILDRAASTSRRGWFVLALGLALSIYAGFPEVSYLDVLFCVGWAGVRLFSLPRRLRPRVLRRLGFASLIGLALALPILVAFGDFLNAAYVGGHTGAVDGAWSLSLKAIPMLFDPYIYGTIYANTHVFTIWGEIGGYFGASICALGIVGLFGHQLRGLRIFLALWIAAGLAGAFNLLGARELWNVIPLLKNASEPRYVMPSCELALIVLAVLGLSDIVSHIRSRRLVRNATLFMMFALLSSLLAAHLINFRMTFGLRARVMFFILGLIPFVALTLVLVANHVARPSLVAPLLSVVLVGESLLVFMAPTLQAPSQITIDYAPIHYLQSHQGEERYFDLSVLYPNWGSQFGLNSLSATDLPFPKNFKDFIQSQLYPGLRPADAFTRDALSGVVGQEEELVDHLVAYEGASVKYLLAPSSIVLLPALTNLGVKSVFHDSVATIYLLPHPRAFFTSPCHVTSPNDDEAVVTCSRSGETLLRTELSMKGWSASVNGRATPITTIDGVYQEVVLPAGQSIVRYDFVPPHEDLALVLALLAALLLLGAFINEIRPFVPRKRRAAHWRQTENDFHTEPRTRQPSDGS